MSFSFAAWDKYCADKVKRTHNKRKAKKLHANWSEGKKCHIISCNL